MFDGDQPKHRWKSNTSEHSVLLILITNTNKMNKTRIKFQQSNFGFFWSNLVESSHFQMYALQIDLHAHYVFSLCRHTIYRREKTVNEVERDITRKRPIIQSFKALWKDQLRACIVFFRVIFNFDKVEQRPKFNIFHENWKVEIDSIKIEKLYSDIGRDNF